MTAIVKFDDPVALGIVHVTGENRGSRRLDMAWTQHLGKPVTVINIVAENERGGTSLNEIGTDDIGWSQALGTGLHRIAK